MEVALTHIPTPIRAGLIVPDSGLLPRSVAISCWLAAKSAQRLEDDTSGSITPERMMRLDRMPHYWPEPVSLPVSENEAGRLSDDTEAEVRLILDGLMQATHLELSKRRELWGNWGHRPERAPC